MKSKSGLFLIELILAILFFTLSATVCVQMFVKAALINRSTEELEQAVRATQNIAEVFRSCDGDKAEILEIMPYLSTSDDEKTLYANYDKNWHYIYNPSKEGYILSAELTSRDGLNVMNISVCSSKTPDLKIYSLEVLDFGGAS